ncbi:hypothetical protein [Soonwooa sp.]|uniref:hypothetical protein n=1 Tax=Soonwooa sp. TaxID=1938592 RepID=UPI0028AB3C7D|nr:hypothetical protein [Soonwooa sp.]
MKAILLSVSTIGLFSCQSPTDSKLEVLTTLPKVIKEASAAEITPASPDLVWTIEDQKNDNILFGFTKNGELKKEIRINNVENNDWEDLTADDAGNIYIGDFGNNDNERQNLAIYKISALDLTKDQTEASEIVEFYYPEQTEFPAKKKDRIYDAESFFIFNNQFYLFTKNRSSKFDGTTSLYRVDNKPGQRLPAKKISSFRTCDNFNHCAVTSAAISPDKKKVAILSSDKVWIFTDFKGEDFFSGKSQMIELDHYTQKEGLTFETNDSLFITDEAAKKGESFLYRLKLK